MSPSEPRVIPVPNYGYIVESASIPGAYRLVNSDGCSCPAREMRTCRHRKAVDAYAAEQNRKYKRPVASPHIAALVD